MRAGFLFVFSAASHCSNRHAGLCWVIGEVRGDDFVTEFKLVPFTM